MPNDRPRAGRPPRRSRLDRPVRLVPPLSDADADVEESRFLIPDMDSPTYHADVQALIGHSRTEVRRRARAVANHTAQAAHHAQRAAAEARVLVDICEMADALSSVVES